MNLAYLPDRKIEAAEPAEKQGVTEGTTCKDCNTGNLRNRRFCSSCGSALEAACEVCGFVNAGTDRFCGGCGDDLREAAHKATVGKTAAVPPAGEARPVTAQRDGSTESLILNPSPATEEKVVDGVVSQPDLEDLFAKKK